MDRRLELHQKLINIVGRAYFQPPESVKLEYPCAIYNLTDIDISHADDQIYRNKRGYSVMIIDRNPDSNYLEDMMTSFQYVRFDRFYVVDNLNHFVFRVYF